MSYATRVTPPASHSAALQEFDPRLRSALENLGGLQLSDVAWRQACLGTAQGGLGLRGAARHAPAAYPASITSTVEACTTLLPQYAPYLSAPLAQFNAMVAPSSALPATPRPVKQQEELRLLLANSDREAACAHCNFCNSRGRAHGFMLAQRKPWG